MAPRQGLSGLSMLSLPALAYMATRSTDLGFLASSGQPPSVLRLQQAETAKMAGASQGNAAQQGQTATSFRSISAVMALASIGLARRNRKQSATARQACFTTEAASVASAALEPASMSLAGGSSALPAATAPVSRTTRHLLMPKNIKWKKPHKPSTKPFRASTKWKFRGYATHGAKPHFGKYALQALEEAWITSKQIENTRRAIIRTMERKGKMWIRVFPHQAVTQRVAESRMGAGKGTIEYWVAPVRPNFILFEIDGVTQDCATTAFRKAKFRLPCKVRMLVKDGPSQFELGLAGKPGRGSGERTKFEGASK